MSQDTKEIRTPNFNNCPVTACIAVIGGKWKPLIVYFVYHGISRFGLLLREIPGISKQMLTKQLRELEKDDILHREAFPEVPPRVEYTLTTHGESLLPVVNSMRLWGEQHLGLKD